jgi:hypothetical protein
MLYIEEGTRHTAWSVSRWFLKEYLSNYDINLTIEERDLSEEGVGVDGWFMKETGNEFTIQIDKNLDYEYIPTLLHELHHLLQEVEGRPRDEYECMSMEQPLYEEYLQRDRQTE